MKPELKLETMEELQLGDNKDPDEFVCQWCGSTLVGVLAIVDMKGNVLIQSAQYVCLADHPCASHIRPGKSILRTPKIDVMDYDFEPCDCEDGLQRRWQYREGSDVTEMPQIGDKS